MKSNDPNRFFLYKLGIILFLCVCAETVFFANAQVKEHRQNSSVGEEISQNSPNFAEENLPNLQNLENPPKQNLQNPQIEISSHEQNLAKPLWEMPFVKMQNYEVIESIVLNSDGYLLGIINQNNKGKLVQIDKNGVLMWEKQISINDLRKNIGVSDSYIMVSNMLIDKFTQHIIMRQDDKAYFNITPFGDNFVACDAANNLYFLDKNLKVKWKKFIKTDLKTNRTSYEYNPDGSLKSTTKHSDTKSVIEQILKINDNEFLVSIAGQGLVKYDLKGNIITEKLIKNYQYVQVILADDGSVFTLKKEKEGNFFYDGVAKISKFDSKLNLLWSKNLHTEDGDDYVGYLLANYKNNLLLIVDKTDRKVAMESWIKFIEFDLDGNLVGKNMISGYPKETNLLTATKMHDNGVLIGGRMLYEQDRPPVLIKGELVKLEGNDIITSGLFIKISSQTPLKKQEIRKFDEEFIRE